MYKDFESISDIIKSFLNAVAGGTESISGCSLTNTGGWGGNCLCDLIGKESACKCNRHKRHAFDPWISKIPWSRKWQPTPVFWPGEFHRQRSLEGYILWGHKELGATEEVNTYIHTHTHMNRHISLQNNRSSIMRGVSPNQQNFYQVPEKHLESMCHS